jgi:putative DNA primase/helicase
VTAPSPPTILPINLAGIPADLRRIPRWVCWEWKQIPEARKPWTKPPVDPKSGRLASVTDSSTWGTFDQAIEYAQRHRLPGIGLVFTDDDDLVGIDLDHCRDPVTGELTKWAAETVDRFASYTEVTPSGTGIRVIVRGSVPGTRRKKPGVAEIYPDDRFFTMTGHVLNGEARPIRACSAEIVAFYAELFPEPQRAPGSSDSRPALQMEDRELIDRALAAANGEKFRRLSAGDISGYASASEADLAFCSIVAFYHADEDQIDRLYRSSGLYREKWEREGYRRDTITLAMTGRKATSSETSRGASHRTRLDGQPVRLVTVRVGR